MTAKFTKKHYEEIADLFGVLTKESKKPLREIHLDEVIDNFVKMFQADSEKFNALTFKNAIEKVSGMVDKEIEV